MVGHTPNHRPMEPAWRRATEPNPAQKLTDPDRVDTRPSPDASRAAALRALYSRHSEDLLSYLKRLVGSGPPDPEDVLQEAFTKLANSKNFEEIRAPHAFLWRTAQNIIANEYRSSSVRNRHQSNVSDVFYSNCGDVFDPQRVLLAKADLTCVLEALDRMDSRRRDVLVMNKIEGISLTAISQRLQISRSAVSKRLGRALAELYTSIHDE